MKAIVSTALTLDETLFEPTSSRAGHHSVRLENVLLIDRHQTPRRVIAA
jgi:hypothetical protein